MKTGESVRICENGHEYYKSSDCSSCPTCDKENKPKNGFLTKLSSPARRALINEGIDTLQQLSKYSEKEILKMHGIGPSSLPKMRTSLEEMGLSFKE